MKELSTISSFLNHCDRTYADFMCCIIDKEGKECDFSLFKGIDCWGDLEDFVDNLKVCALQDELYSLKMITTRSDESCKSCLNAEKYQRVKLETLIKEFEKYFKKHFKKYENI